MHNLGSSGSLPHKLHLSDVHGIQSILSKEPQFYGAIETLFSGHLAVSSHRSYDWILNEFRLYSLANGNNNFEINNSEYWYYLQYDLLYHKFFTDLILKLKLLISDICYFFSHIYNYLDFPYPNFSQTSCLYFLIYSVWKERSFNWFKKFTPALESLETSMSREPSQIPNTVRTGCKTMMRKLAQTKVLLFIFSISNLNEYSI